MKERNQKEKMTKSRGHSILPSLPPSPPPPPPPKYTNIRTLGLVVTWKKMSYLGCRRYNLGLYRRFIRKSDARISKKFAILSRNVRVKKNLFILYFSSIHAEYF